MQPIEKQVTLLAKYTLILGNNFLLLVLRTSKIIEQPFSPSILLGTLDYKLQGKEYGCFTEQKLTPRKQVLLINHTGFKMETSLH